MAHLSGSDAAWTLGACTLNINSAPGQLLLALGFFVFVGIIAAGVFFGVAAQDHYRRGLSNINPCGCGAIAFLTLLLVALVRSLV